MKMDMVVLVIRKDTKQRLRRLGTVDESDDTIINRIIDYIGFHLPEFKNSGS